MRERLTGFRDKKDPLYRMDTRIVRGGTKEKAYGVKLYEQLVDEYIWLHGKVIRIEDLIEFWDKNSGRIRREHTHSMFTKMARVLTWYPQSACHHLPVKIGFKENFSPLHKSVEPHMMETYRRCLRHLLLLYVTMTTNPIDSNVVIGYKGDELS
jgi:hypothetical protein